MTGLLVTDKKVEKSPLTNKAKKLYLTPGPQNGRKVAMTLASSMATKEGSNTASVHMSGVEATNVDPFSDTTRTLDGDGCVGMDNDNTERSLLDRS